MKSPILCIVFVAVLALISASPVANEIDKRQNSNPGSCTTTDNRFYTNGQVYNVSPCEKFQCVNGQLKEYEMGCNHKGVCRAVDSTFEIGCEIHKCSLVTRNGQTGFLVESIQMMCPDHNQKCHGPGKEFEFIVGGVAYKCNCTYEDKGARYRCQ